MNKTELIRAVAAKTQTSRRQTAQVVAALLAAVQDAVIKGEKVTIPGFGSFYARRLAARKARNLRTGQVMQVPAGRVPGFRAGSSFKKAVRG